MLHHTELWKEGKKEKTY